MSMLYRFFAFILAILALVVLYNAIVSEVVIIKLSGGMRTKYIYLDEEPLQYCFFIFVCFVFVLVCIYTLINGVKKIKGVGDK